MKSLVWRSAGRMRFKKRMATAIPKMETEIKSACLMAPVQFAGDAITESATLYFSACVSASRRTEERYTLPHDSHVHPRYYRANANWPHITGGVDKGMPRTLRAGRLADRQPPSLPACATAQSGLILPAPFANQHRCAEL